MKISYILHWLNDYEFVIDAAYETPDMAAEALMALKAANPAKSYSIRHGLELHQSLADVDEFGAEPRLRVSEYCSALRTWSKLAVKGGIVSQDLVSTLELAITKSALLWRMLYCGEDVRLNPCPVHGGKWSGCLIDCECGGCGWLPNKDT